MELKRFLLKEERQKKTLKKKPNKITNIRAFRIVVEKLHKQYKENNSKNQEESKKIIEKLNKETLNQKLKLGTANTRRNNVYELRQFNLQIRKKEV